MYVCKKHDFNTVAIVAKLLHNFTNTTKKVEPSRGFATFAEYLNRYYTLNISCSSACYAHSVNFSILRFLINALGLAVYRRITCYGHFRHNCIFLALRSISENEKIGRK